VTPDEARWDELAANSEAYTCYSAALAAWSGIDDPGWRRVVNAGLTLRLVDADDGLFGFVHFPARLRADIGLSRTSADGAGEAVAGILEELEREGRVIVAGDGFNLPWHVAVGRRHVPHWFVLAGTPAAPTVVDPFSCLNDLGRQEAVRRPVSVDELPQLARAHPGDDPVVALREAFALGDDARPVSTARYQWLVREPAPAREPDGPTGPDALRRLAESFRERGHEAAAYRQSDDIWSIARHRAFLTACARRHPGAEEWAAGHLEPLAKRWTHMAPLLMQATLAVGAGRRPTGSVADTLDDLAEREGAAAAACPDAAKTLLSG
jgi:hypothetical protein